MADLKLYDGEYRLCDIVWNFEPLRSTELVRLCAEQLGWKKSTTYTVLKKMCERGILQNQNALVTSIVTREQVQKYESENLLKRAFDGSVPAFLAAFLRGRRLTEEEASDIRRLIDEAGVTRGTEEVSKK